MSRRLRRSVIWGVGVFVALLAFVYLPGGDVRISWSQELRFFGTATVRDGAIVLLDHESPELFEKYSDDEWELFFSNQIAEVRVYPTFDAFPCREFPLVRAKGLPYTILGANNHTLTPEERKEITRQLHGIMSARPLAAAWAPGEPVRWRIPWRDLAPSLALHGAALGAIIGVAWVIQYLRDRYAPPPGCCANCRYDLRGLTGQTCPECGSPVLAPVSAPEPSPASASPPSA